MGKVGEPVGGWGLGGVGCSWMAGRLALECR